MSLLLREVRSADITAEVQDRELPGATITVGSRQDQDIQLLGVAVLGQHAELKASGGSISVKALSGAKLRINGEETKSGKLGTGDRLEIGGHVLQAVAAPAGFDGAVELTPDPDVDSATFENAYQTSLDETWLSKRGPAWLLLALVAVFGLAIPLALVLDGDDSTPSQDASLLTDAIWTSGPLHAVHNQSIGDDCAACHTTLFERVQDEACLACHKNLNDHVALDHPSLETYPTERCAVCHKEHNEPTLLVIEADSLCTDCHEDAEALGGDSPHMERVTGFELATHPAFEVAIPRAVATPAGTGLAFEWGLVESELKDAVETSNLKFPHDIHLDTGSVRTQSGEALACGDCHELQPDREHFVPISMEDHCRDCHELTFDAAAPQRQLPHGQPSEAVATMEGHFIRVYADPNRVAPKPRERRRRPGRSVATPTSSCSGSPLACALERTEVEVMSQFTRSGCVTCHQVEDTGSSDLSSRFQVYPVRLAEDFMPTAIFDHQAHFTQKDKEGDEACLTCHEVTTSNVATDLSIPDIDNCTECHTDFTVADTVPLDCVDCHSYHPHALDAFQFTERSP